MDFDGGRGVNGEGWSEFDGPMFTAGKISSGEKETLYDNLTRGSDYFSFLFLIGDPSREQIVHFFERVWEA